MNIVICGSIDFTPDIKKAADTLTALGHTVDIPLTSKRILEEEISMEDFLRERHSKGKDGISESTERKINDNVIKRYFDIIQKSDAILVLNIDKKNTSGYIGGNTFLEIGFAHVLNKKIFLLNEIPEMPYTDEIRAMQPIILNGNIAKIE